MTYSIRLGDEGFNGIAFTSSELSRSVANATLLDQADAIAVQMARVAASRAEAVQAAWASFDAEMEELAKHRLQLIEGANAIAYDVLDNVRQRDPTHAALPRSRRRRR